MQNATKDFCVAGNTLDFGSAEPVNEQPFFVTPPTPITFVNVTF